ncbi:tyrosine-type recombinase/integrase [Halorubrum ezzemoulense]|uniref:tyrosine-type recombinase/integrase n=1 Tax=Halorubrum ezzemoulense TaxID=337243 RepID=UPI00232BEF35|nr:tyrosine-type recombinase/integrase [Halorubrum ezzemoulense]MDB2269513.1 tyrosine-type recombinase/integrase [Halorubrum ezzemoulense]
MSEKNHELTDFSDEHPQESTESPSTNEDVEDSDLKSNNHNHTKTATNESYICDYYVKIRSEYKSELEDLSFTPPECGYCIEYLCTLSSGTGRRYSSCLNKFINWLHKEGICIKDVTFINVRDYFEFRAEEGLATSTIQVYKSAISGVISRYEAEHKEFPAVSWKIENNIDPKDYSDGKSYERRPLTDEEVNKLLEALDDVRNQLMVLTILELGPRSEATRRIKTSDVDLEEKTIKLQNTKYDREYAMPLNDDFASLLKHWIENLRLGFCPDEDNPYLFPSREGEQLSSSRFITIVGGAAEEAGIQEVITEMPYSRTEGDVEYKSKYKVDVHSLRHTFSRLLKRDKISKPTRAYALDHSLDVTDSYGVDKEACREELRNDFNGLNISEL